MLCPLWDPIVFTVVEYVLATLSGKVYNYKSVTYRLCLNSKTLNHDDSLLYGALMYSGYTAVRYC